MKVIKDKDLSENLNIPSSTLQDWKKTEDGNWRNKIYNFQIILTQIYLKKIEKFPTDR